MLFAEEMTDTGIVASVIAGVMTLATTLLTIYNAVQSSRAAREKAAVEQLNAIVDRQEKQIGDLNKQIKDLHTESAKSRYNEMICRDEQQRQLGLMEELYEFALRQYGILQKAGLTTELMPPKPVFKVPRVRTESEQNEEKKDDE